MAPPLLPDIMTNLEHDLLATSRQRKLFIRLD